MLSKYHEEGISVPVPAEEQNLVNRHRKAFLDNMSDDLKTTDVLDGEDGLTDLLKAINSNMNDLKVCWYCFLLPCSKV
jgi:cysteinyl-tRNA synthetase